VEAGITPEPHWGNSATWWDYNNDGWSDLYVGNDFKSPDLFYRNNGDGTFTEVSQGMFRHTTWNSMGAAQADFDNRGLFDFIIADMLPRNHYMQKASMGSLAQRRRELSNIEGVNQIMRNTFHIHTGTERFLEGAWMAGLAHTDWTWAIRAGDLDADGYVDLFFTNGVPGQFTSICRRSTTPISSGNITSIISPALRSAASRTSPSATAAVSGSTTSRRPGGSRMSGCLTEPPSVTSMATAGSTCSSAISMIP
jgi:hypothetical protein